MKIKLTYLLISLLLLSRYGWAEQPFFMPNYNENILGNGMDLKSQRLYMGERCLLDPENSTLTINNDTGATITFHRDVSFRQLVDNISGGGHAKIDFWIASGEVSLDFLLNNNQSDRALSLLFTYDVNGPVTVIQNPKIDPAVVERVRLNYLQCGDGYVSGYQLGAKLYARVDVRVSSREKLRELRARIKAYFIGIEVFNQEFVEILRQVDQYAKISLAFRTAGINETLLFQKLGRTYSNGITCAHSANYMDCVNLFNGVVRATSSQEFAAVFDSSEFEPIKFFYTDYGHAGLGLLDKTSLDSPDSRPLALLDYAYEDIVSEMNDIRADYDESVTKPPHIDERFQLLNTYMDEISDIRDDCQSEEDIDFCQSRVDMFLTSIEPPLY